MTVRIGLIDDHPVVIGGLEAALNAVPDFAVVARAEHLDTGRKLIDQVDIDVVLLDIRLGDGNGLSLLRAGNRPDGPAIIVLSSFDSSQYVAAALRLGAQGFLLKTAPLDQLAAAIRHVASGGSWFSADQLRRGESGVVTLTPRERQVVGFVLEGLSNDEIAAHMGASRKTIEAYLSRLYERFGVLSRLELGLRAEREGWLDLDLA